MFVQTVGVLLFIGSFILLLGYTGTGIVNSDDAMATLLLVLPAIAGFSVGEVLRANIPADRFQKLVLQIFLILDLNFIRRAFIM